VLSSALSNGAQAPSTCPPEARPPSAAQVEEGARTARDRGFLWRVSKDGRTSYLYGTVHVGKMEWMFPGPEVLRAVRSTEVVALELDILDADLIRRLQEGTTRKPGQPLPSALNLRLKAQLKAACLPEELLSQAAPEMVATTLTMMAARQEGLDPAYAVDAVYAGMARSLNKPVSSLETPELQLKLLLGGTVAESREAVEAALEELESGKASPLLLHMAQVWADGRLGELESYENWCECLKTETERVMMRRLLDERNPGLASGIDAIHASGRSVFAAVGSLHMIGKLGLPALLAKRGYKVERVDFNP
jgi:uncharacterized protein YbaP (TraB family)